MVSSRFLKKGLQSVKRNRARASLLRQVERQGFPPILWSKRYGGLAEQNGGLKEILGRTEKRWSIRKFRSLYDSSASSYWLPLTSGGKSGRSCPLDWFVEHVLPGIDKKFTLITTDGPSVVPYDLDPLTVNAILQDCRLDRWYSQNVVDVKFHPKLVGVPLGIDLHTDRGGGVGWQLYSEFYDIATSYRNAGLDVVADCCLNINSKSRAQILDLVADNGRFFVPKNRIQQQDLWRHYSQSRYVLSPEGVGADCHRTWEALYMGARVICKDVGLGALYRRLPVFQVDSWEEILERDFFDKVEWHCQNKENIWDLGIEEWVPARAFSSEVSI